MEDLYNLLGIDRRASAAEIRRAFRRRSKQVHPDVNGGAPAAEEQFKRLNEAFQILSDPIRRRQYDQQTTNAQQPAAKGTAYQPAASDRRNRQPKTTTDEAARQRPRWSPYFILYGFFIAWLVFLGHELFRPEQPRRGTLTSTIGPEQQRFLELYQYYPDLISTREASLITNKKYLPSGYTNLLESLLQRGDTALFRKFIVLQTDPEAYRNRIQNEENQRYSSTGD